MMEVCILLDTKGIRSSGYRYETHYFDPRTRGPLCNRPSRGMTPVRMGSEGVLCRVCRSRVVVGPPGAESARVVRVDKTLYVTFLDADGRVICRRRYRAGSHSATKKRSLVKLADGNFGWSAYAEEEKP